MNLPHDIVVILKREGVKLRQCKDADAEHLEYQRQYAHVGCQEYEICVAGAFFTLPIEHQRGLILHELGHIALQDINPDHSERDADVIAHQRYKVKVEYRSTEHGRRLQWAER